MMRTRFNGSELTFPWGYAADRVPCAAMHKKETASWIERGLEAYLYPPNQTFNDDLPCNGVLLAASRHHGFVTHDGHTPRGD